MWTARKKGIQRSIHDARATTNSLSETAPDKHGFLPGVCGSATSYVSVGQVTGIPVSLSLVIGLTPDSSARNRILRSVIGVSSVASHPVAAIPSASLPGSEVLSDDFFAVVGKVINKLVIRCAVPGHGLPRGSPECCNGYEAYHWA